MMGDGEICTCHRSKSNQSATSRGRRATAATYWKPKRRKRLKPTIFDWKLKIVELTARLVVVSWSWSTLSWPGFVKIGDDSGLIKGLSFRRVVLVYVCATGKTWTWKVGLRLKSAHDGPELLREGGEHRILWSRKCWRRLAEFTSGFCGNWWLKIRF